MEQSRWPYEKKLSFKVKTQPKLLFALNWGLKINIVGLKDYERETDILYFHPIRPSRINEGQAPKLPIPTAFMPVSQFSPMAVH